MDEDTYNEELVHRIHAYDAFAMEEFYKILNVGPRRYIYQLINPEDAEDALHDVFIIVVSAIQQGRIHEPKRLMSYMWTVTRRTRNIYIHGAIANRERSKLPNYIKDPGDNPEQIIVRRELPALHKLKVWDKKILTRFYLQEHTQDQIRLDMQLTANQFRLRKSRALARLRLKCK